MKTVLIAMMMSFALLGASVSVLDTHIQNPIVSVAKADASAPLPSVIVAPTGLPTDQEISGTISQLGNLKGTLAIVAFIVQVLMLLLRTPLANFAGKYKLLIVSFLTLAGTAVAYKIQGLGWIAILTDGTILTIGQVFAHQVISQFFTKSDSTPPAAV
jgi:hypothetical protein